MNNHHQHPHTLFESTQGLADNLLSELSELQPNTGARSELAARTPDWGGRSSALMREEAGSPLRLAQPLVAIGVGGTGRKMVTRLKANLLDKYGAVPANAALLAFDSGSERIIVRDRYGRVVELQPRSEAISLENVPIANIKREPHYHPELVTRLGDALPYIQRVTIMHGTARERAQGLAALYYYAPVVVETIRRALHRVTGRKNAFDLAGPQAAGMNLLLAGSTAGGQGSGALADIGLLTREELSAFGPWADITRTIALLALPSAFGGRERTNALMGPNTYAFLHELNQLMSSRRLELSYPGNLHVVHTEPLFDQVFVVEGVDERGYNWPNLDEVCDMAARGLGQLLCSDVGLEEIAYTINEEAITSRTSLSGLGAYLGSLGSAELFFSGQQVAKQCILRQANAVLERSLAPLEQAPAAADSAPTLDLGQWQQQLQQAAGQPHIQIRLPADIEEAEPAQLPGRVRTYVQLFVQRRVLGVAWPPMQKASTAALTAVLERYTHWLERMAAEGMVAPVLGGLRAAAQHAVRTEQQLHQLQCGVAEEYEARQRESTAADLAMGQAAESFLIGRRQRTAAAVQRYVAVQTGLAQVELQRQQLTLLGDLLQQVRTWMDSRLLEAESAEGRLRQVGERLLEDSRRLGAPPIGRNVYNLAEAGLVDELFRQHAPDPAVALRSAQSVAGGLLAWAAQAPQVIIDILVQVIAPAFSAVAELTVEEVLRLRWPERSAEEWVKVLEELAAAAWSLDRAKLPPGHADLTNFLTLGVPDKESSLFAKTMYTCTSTGDPQRITALRTVYGASIDALKSYPRWEREYQRALKWATPLHVLPGFRQSTERTALLFGLGLALNYIGQKGTHYYYQPLDPMAQPSRLGNGPANAYTGFASLEWVAAEVDERSSNHIAQVGNAQASRQLEQWLATVHEKNDELYLQVRRAMRAYVDQLAGL